MVGKKTGIIIAGIGCISFLLFLVTLADSTAFTWPCLYVAVSCALSAVFFWELGSCSASLAILAKEKVATQHDAEPEALKEEIKKPSYSSMLCPNCGFELNALATVCPKCKTRFRE